MARRLLVGVESGKQPAKQEPSSAEEAVLASHGRPNVGAVNVRARRAAQRVESRLALLEPGVESSEMGAFGSASRP